uniref:Uncharacterized protein n=1 Tax=Arundo donax TaxID=35708 RepID=A0A0A9GH07_ARUDO
MLFSFGGVTIFRLLSVFLLTTYGLTENVAFLEHTRFFYIRQPIYYLHRSIPFRSITYYYDTCLDCM